ncbi:MAG: hypothetical protein U0133_00450 [Gemmatimonadales bacterium]
MLSLREIVPNAGVPKDDFVFVPLHAPNIVRVEGGTGDAQIKASGKVKVEKLTKANHGAAVEKMMKLHSAGETDAAADRRKAFKAGVLHAVSQNPGRVFALHGVTSGFGSLTLTAGKESREAGVGVSQPKSFALAFRFLRHTDGTSTAPDTAHDPKEVDRWIAELNWIFGPQANVHFTLQDTDWVTVGRKPDQPIKEPFFLETVASAPSTNADLTIYLVGDWRGSSNDADGTYYRDRKIVVLTDAPNHPEIPKEVDIFLLVLAHEILHHLRALRGATGHHDRKNVLLSSGIQTLRIDKQLIIDVNIPGG